MTGDLAVLLPEMALAGAAVTGLLAGSWLPRHRQWAVGALAALACTAGLVAAVAAWPTGAAATAGPGESGAGAAASDGVRTAFSAAFTADTATGAGRVVVLGALLLVLAMSAGAVRGDRRESEYTVLLLLSGLGTLTMVGAGDLLTLFAGYLLASVPAYALAGFAKDAPGTEAALKYYLMGALLGVVMLAGAAVLYGAGGSTAYRELRGTLGDAPYGPVAVGLVAVLAGLLFKAGGVPGHFWLPDTAEGAPPAVAAYVTTLPKAGGLIAAYRVLHDALPASATGVDWTALVAVLAAASMTLGNLAAFFQTSVRRLLAYSAISQAGYLLVAVAMAGRSGQARTALLFYLGAYAVTNLGAFAVVAALPRARILEDYRGLAGRSPLLAAVLVVCLLGLVGTPPTGVFLGKLLVFGAAVDGGYAWLAALAVANTVASLFYYLRWLGPLFRPAAAGPPVQAVARPDAWCAGTAYAAAAASVLLGLAGGAVLAPLTAGPA